MTETFIIKRNFGTGKNNFGYIPDPPEPPSDEWYEEHCPRCKHYLEVEENGKTWAECKLLDCEFEEDEENDPWDYMDDIEREEAREYLESLQDYAEWEGGKE